MTWCLLLAALAGCAAVRGWVENHRADRQVSVRRWDRPFPLSVAVWSLDDGERGIVAEAVRFWNAESGRDLLKMKWGFEGDVLVRFETPETPGAVGEALLHPRRGPIHGVGINIAPGRDWLATIRTAKHELGHAIGLGHIRDAHGIMSPRGTGAEVTPAERKAMGWD